MSKKSQQSKALYFKVRSSSPHWRTFILISFMLALVQGNPTGAAPTGQGGVVGISLSYRLFRWPQSISLCSGQMERIDLFLVRSISIPAAPSFSPMTEWIEGAYIQGFTEDPNIIDFDYVNVTHTRLIRGGDPSEPEAFLVVVAGEPGRTTLRFEVISTGEESRFGRVNIPPQTVDVEVTPCYGAYAGAGIQNYTQKDICSLDRPFTLEGQADGREFGVPTPEISSRQYQFTPSVRSKFDDPIEGSFVLKQKFDKCQVYSGGTFTIKFYTPSKTEGDIMMTGAGTLICPRYASAIPNFNPQIAFRALSQGDVCDPGN